MKLEYILSGLGYTRINNNFMLERPEELKRLADQNRNFNQKNPYDISGLFNAYTERSIGKALHDNTNMGFKSVHGDSGGLQMITLGKTVTPSIKKEIYSTQSKYSQYAMCFDEIPLEVMSGSSNQSNRTSVSNKAFIIDQLKDSAILTGKNINEQLRHFKESETKSKVMMIAQGNEPQDFADFLHYAYDQIDDDLKSDIGGISLADTCIGNGVLESVDMTASYPLIDLPEDIKKYIHLLGVGSLSRLMPVLEMKRGGFLPDDIKISFDSTTHTSCQVMGKIITGDAKMVGFGKERSVRLETYFKKQYEKYLLPEDKDQCSVEEYVNINMDSSINTKGLSDFNENDRWFAQLGCWYSAMQNSHEFMDAVQSCYEDPENYERILNKSQLKQLKPIFALGDVSSYDDYKRWRFHFSRKLQSKRISRHDTHYDFYNTDITSFI